MSTYTHPNVLSAGVTAGWADPETDPTRIDWPARQRAAAIWFDVEAELAIQEYIDAELADRDPADLRHLAESYLRLVSAIEMTMADISDWDDDQLSEVQRLTRYLAHLTEATRGACDVCRRAIFAPHQVTELPRRRWWHPRRWLDAAVDALTALRYGGHRTAHSSCIRRHP